MDEIDRKILSEIQCDGRISVTELAERVGLSLSPCHRRLRALEDDKVVMGYRAILDPLAVGMNFSALVFVTLSQGDQKAVAAFEHAVTLVTQVVKAERLFGTPDYLLQVVCQDLPDFQHLYDQRLSRLPSVLRLTSTLVMKTVVADRVLPI